ncbi:ubiquitin-protein ligase (hul4) [Fusarium flagelliforme]|uniref:Ubiquitin-protein ligase (Hul4) n=2 Tax=Fusarium flagelliforme TaxID=2675880 RepID=A0A395MEX5_9HYPO|nr:ubiquitin-protein ligase (hul4) [Fusarium flagelliforme]
MSISNSPLFKEFARPILVPEPSQGRASYSPFGLVDTFVKHLLDTAKLQSTRFKISNATKDSFCLTIQGRLVETGTISSTIDAMEASLSFNGFRFGKVRFPQIQTSYWGTNFVIQEQRIDISNHATYCAFVRSLIVDEETCLQLDSKECTIRALRASPTCGIRLDMPLQAQNGPHLTLKKVSRSAKDVRMVLSLSYSGQVEMNYGSCLFVLRNGPGEILAELKGELNISKSQKELVLHGIVKYGVIPSQMVRLIGVAVEEDEESWLSKTISDFDVVLDLEPEHAEMLWL